MVVTQNIMPAQHHLRDHPVDRVVGFNKMPALMYYAAASCYAESRTGKGFFYRLTSRYRHYAAFERAIVSEHASADATINADE